MHISNLRKIYQYLLLDTEHKLNKHKMFRRRPRRHLRSIYALHPGGLYSVKNFQGRSFSSELHLNSIVESILKHQKFLNGNGNYGNILYFDFQITIFVYFLSLNGCKLTDECQ